MYDLPGTRKLLDAFWHGLRRHLQDVGLRSLPARIPHGLPLKTLWSDPELLLSQCCGLDIVKRYVSRLRPIATPRYGAAGCKATDYCSVVVVAEHVRANDVLAMRGAVCVVNGYESHSGMNALRYLVAPRSRDGRFFSKVKVSGSHEASLAMLRHGKADVSAIDCVTYALFGSYQPEALLGTRQIGWTHRAPGIPYVTRCDIGEDVVRALRAGLSSAFADPSLADLRRALYLKGLEILPSSAYDRLLDAEAFAHRYNYPELK